MVRTTGGSTNAVLHLLAMARTAGVPLRSILRFGAEFCSVFAPFVCATSCPLLLSARCCVPPNQPLTALQQAVFSLRRHL
jgi:hypothetical protein